MINHDLLAALATLVPGGTHELHPPSPGQPSIVVHTALGEFLTIFFALSSINCFSRNQ